MRKHLLTIVTVTACLLVVAGVSALAAPALPYDTNAECLECHGVEVGEPAFAAVDFTAANGVDYQRCWKCHVVSSDHYPETQCNIPGCHSTWPDRDVYYNPNRVTEFGIFDTVNSLSTSPAELHEIHVNGSWIQGLQTMLGCDECHRPARCGTCHGSAAAAHGDHTWDDGAGAYAYDPVEYIACNGRDYLTEVSTCVNDACHALGAAGASGFESPDCGGCHSARHADQPVAHDSGVAECGESGCHPASDVTLVHGATPEEPFAGCITCHTPDSSPESSDCTACHPTAAVEHHEVHDGAAGMTSGCTKCHDPYIDDEHAARGYACAACHDSADAVVAAAISGGAWDCYTCHPDGHFRRGRR